MTRFVTPFVVTLALGALTGCDGRADTDYHGTPLLSLTGSVHIQNADAPSELVPALAFRNHKTDSLEILDVDVTGEFPARFTLDVFTPPSEETYVELDEEFANEPRFSVGAVAAVTPDHPDSIPLRNWGGIGASGCEAIDEQGTPGNCFMERQWCRGQDCYVEKSACDPDFTTCEVVEQSGNPDLKKDPWEHLAGLSRNYAVLYLATPAGPETTLSYFYAGGRRLEAGYHLLHIGPMSPEEAAAATACQDGAEAAAFAEYNAAHGTSYVDYFDIPDTDPAGAIIEARVWEFQREMRCPGSSETKITEVGPTRDAPISIEIGADTEPAFPL